MEAQMIYPTAPVDMHHPASDAASPRAHHTEGGQHVESSGKPEGMMSKVKRKAKKLKDKIKKSAGSNSTDNDHGDINMRDQEDMLHQHAPGPDDEELDEGAESCEDDEEDHDHINPDDKQFQYQQLRSIGALGNQEEVEVHGGIPVSALAATLDTYGKSAADDVPIGPYKNGGPPGTLQATPTEYHNYAADNDPLLQLGGEGKKTDNSDVNVDWTTDSLGLPALAEVKTSKSPAELHAEVGASGNSADMDLAYPEDIVKPNPRFGHPTSATYDKIGVMNEDLSTDRKLGVGHNLEDSSGKGKENLLETAVPEFAELSGYDQSSAPASVGADELVYRPVSDPHEGSFPTHPPGILDGVVHELNEIAQAAETGQPIDSNTPAFLSDGEYSSTPGEEKRVFDSADGVKSGEEKRVFDSADGVKSLSVEPSPHEEAAEPDKNQYESCSKWSADKQDKVKDEGSFPTSAPGTVVGAICEPNAVLQAYGTGESLDGRTRSFAKETGDPSTSVEERLISDTTNGVGNLSLEQSAHGETAEPEKNQQERWGELSANKLSNAKAVGTNGEGEPPRSGSNNAIDAVAIRVDGSDGAPNLQNDEYVDALSKPRVSEDVRKDLDDEEFYDPNDVKDSQFQEGFALGSGHAEEDALNSTLAGSAIGKLHGLTETVASTLGYGNTASPHTEGGGDGEENPRGDVNISPTQQQTGFVKGWKDTVASTFGYGKELTDEVSHRDEDAESHVAEKEYKPEVGIDGSEQQTGGPLQGLKNVVVSKLGYGTGGELHSPSENTRTHNTPVKDAQPRYDDDGEHGGVRKAAHVSGECAHTEGESQNEQQMGVFQGMKNMVTSKLGFGAEGLHTTETGHMTHDEVPAVASEERAGDNHQADGYTQKLFNSTAAARDYLSSKIGYGNSDQGKDDRDLAYAGEGEKPINPLIDNYDAEGQQRV